MKILKNLNQDYLRNFLISKQMKVSLNEIKVTKTHLKSITYNTLSIYIFEVLEEYSDKSSKKLLKKLQNLWTKIDYKKLQFKELSNELSPLDFYNSEKWIVGN